MIKKYFEREREREEYIEVRCSDVLSSRLRKQFSAVISHIVILSGFEEEEEMEKEA